MDYTIFVDLIGTVGLPIALVIAMGAFIYKIYKKSEEREDALREEIKEIRNNIYKAEKSTR